MVKSYEFQLFCWLFILKQLLYFMYNAMENCMRALHVSLQSIHLCEWDRVNVQCWWWFCSRHSFSSMSSVSCTKDCLFSSFFDRTFINNDQCDSSYLWMCSFFSFHSFIHFSCNRQPVTFCIRLEDVWQWTVCPIYFINTSTVRPFSNVNSIETVDCWF